MPNYSLDCLDGAGRIESAEVLDAKNDGEAIILARAMKKAVSCEVWQGNRLVAHLPAMQHHS